MQLPPLETPLYNHPLPVIEFWLTEIGCVQNSNDVCSWLLKMPNWQAQLLMDVEEIHVHYTGYHSEDVRRAFPYSLSRGDVESAILAGP
ncbi:MAG: DUF3143 domain-containing protein [Oscillatoriales cyanobacterium SM2_2_1]|nr:DUF3143 domain-containing protein [Oscillatoriales cyanobacterium SM2_2_1]